MNYDILKQFLATVSSSAAGFYLGGRYVGQLATPTYSFTQPRWIAEAQNTLWIVLALAIVTALMWVIIDYQTYETE